MTFTRLYLLFLLLFHGTCLLKSQEYWQQEVNYKIEVRLDDIRHELRGSETLEYINHSPDALTYLYFHLWPNAYANNQTALAKQKLRQNPGMKLFDIPANQGFMDSISFMAEGQALKTIQDSVHNDIIRVILNKPLLSGQSIIISTPFHVKIPMGGISRMGHIGQSYQISQWYPKPAVYDKKGWHPIPYLDLGEFYSEFGSFDVSISLPANYIVGATGELQTPEEMDRMNNLAEKTAKLDSFPKRPLLIPSDKSYKTIRYTEKKVHDFAWFADKNFYILKGKVILPNSKDTVTTWSLFPGYVGNYWRKSPQYIQDAVFWYSSWLGDYPYKNCTALEGPLGAGGGMEYPGITIVKSGNSDYVLDQVITHEVGHNWLYGILGFNERDYPFMDEGINTYFEMRYLKTKYPHLTLNDLMANSSGAGKFLELDHLPVRKYYELMYLGPATYRTDQPVTLTSEAYSYVNYGTMVYSKTGLCFDYLRSYLGESEFDKIMQQFYQTWKFKHPQPEDLRDAFEKNTNKDVSWFFESLLPTDKKLDYKISRKRGSHVLIKNKGSLTTPLLLQGISNEKEIYSQWYDGFQGKKWLLVPDSVVDHITIDNNLETPELYRQNNYLKTKGLFRQMEPVRFKLLTTLDDYKYSVIQYIPVIAWNSGNKMMAGALFHNGLLLKKPFEYQLMPLFGFYGSKLAGMGNLTYNFFPSFANIRILSFSFSAMQFAYDKRTDFDKMKIEGKAVFSTRDSRFYPSHIISANFEHLTDLQHLLLSGRNGHTNIFNLNYTFQNPPKTNFTRLEYNFKANESFGRTSLEAIYNLKLTGITAPLTFRMFSGYMFYKDKQDYYSPFFLNGRSNLSDFEYEGIFPGRFDAQGFWNHQFLPTEGAFAVPYNLSADRLLLSLGMNLKPFSGKPRLLTWFQVYGNIASIQSEDATKNEDFLYEAGVKWSPFSAFEIYFPVLFDKSKISYSNYGELIRFNLNLKILNPFNIMERITSI